MTGLRKWARAFRLQQAQLSTDNNTKVFEDIVLLCELSLEIDPSSSLTSLVHLLKASPQSVKD